MIMKTETTRRPPKAGRRERYTFLPDPPKKIDVIRHKILAGVHATLEKHYWHDPATLVGCGGYLCRAPGDARRYIAFDCVVAFGVEADRLIREANGYAISEVGKPPDFVLDIDTKNSRVRDYPVKRLLYQKTLAGEYWRFDSTGGKHHAAPLTGDILVDGEYRAIEIRAEPDGTFRGYSPALGLYLVWDDGDLRFYDPEIEAFPPSFSESEDLREEAEREREEAERERDDAERAAAVERAGRIIAESGRSDAERRAEAERDARTAAEAARAESEAARIAAEAELERLRRLLGDSE